MLTPTRPLADLPGIVMTVERRAEARHPADGDASCCTFDGKVGAGFMARVWDISRTGIGLLLDHPVGPGTFLMVVLLPRRDLPLKLLARVKHATEHQGGSWVVGCELVHRLSDDDLGRLL